MRKLISFEHAVVGMCGRRVEARAGWWWEAESRGWVLSSYLLIQDVSQQKTIGSGMGGGKDDLLTSTYVTKCFVFVIFMYI